jgi:HEPN domain-containing protein
MAKEQSLEKLEKLIDEFTNVEGGMLYRNSFALACFLAQQGEVRASEKFLKSLFEVLGWEGNKTYFLGIIGSIKDKNVAAKYAKEICAHAEINALFSAPHDQ